MATSQSHITPVNFLQNIMKWKNILINILTNQYNIPINKNSGSIPRNACVACET